MDLTLKAILQSCSLLFLLWFLYTSTRYCLTSSRSRTKASKLSLLRITLSNLRVPVTHTLTFTDENKSENLTVHFEYN